MTGGGNIPKIVLVACRGISGVIINENKKLPIRNIEIYLSEMRMDYFVDNGNGSKTTNNPDAVKEYSFKIGDLSKDTKTGFINQQNAILYKEILYSYRVTWLNGYYFGVFIIPKVDDAGCKIVDNKITAYTCASTSSVVRINNNDHPEIIHPKK